MSDCYRCVVKVNVGPLQSERFALPQTNTQGQGVKCLETVAAYRVQKDARLLWSEWLNPPRRTAWRLGKSRDIPSN